MALVVSETFASLMGESTRAGMPAYFIRLTGCNLRCRYCDTAYAYEGGSEMTVAALVDKGPGPAPPAGAGYRRRTVAPGRDPGAAHGVARGRLDDLPGDQRFLPIGCLDARVHRILDVKGPGSGMAEHNDWGNLDLLTPGDEVKFVVGDRSDFTWALEVIERHGLAERLPVLISPVFGQVSLQEAAAWILASGLPVRLNLQLHKYIWGPEVRGV